MRRHFRFLALVTLVGALLVPAPAQALTYVQINAETLATDAEFCGSATNTFTVPSYETLAVVGETGRLTGSCNINLTDGARLYFQRATIKSLNPAGYLGVFGHGQTALTMEDSKVSLTFEYINPSLSATHPGNASVEIVRTVFDGPIVVLASCDGGRIRFLESEFVSGIASGYVLFLITSAASDCTGPFQRSASIEVRNSSFDTRGGGVVFEVYTPPAAYGTLVVRETKFAPGDAYSHVPNPSP